MLILSRRQDQTIEISGGITVKVLEIRNGRVRIGVTAPDDVDVMRGEIHAAKLAECLAAESGESPNGG